MPHFDWKILPLLLLLPACKKEQNPESQLLVSASEVSLRAAPTEKSQEIAALSKGKTLTDLGEVSQSESQIVVGEQVYQMPWIKVQTTERQTGWVLAWAIRPAQKQADWLLQKRMTCYFGKPLALRRNIALRDFGKLESAEQLAGAWREYSMLRDTFLQLLSRRSETGFQPKFDWLSELLPGFILQKSEAGNRPQIFSDLAAWHQKALKTNGLEDDAFFQCCLVVFSKDSIESFFPAWKFQLTETESASQLGMGQHRRALRQIDRSLEAGTLFALELEVFKDLALEDIFGKNVRYWQPQERILEELRQIMADPPRCLNTREREALGIRQRMFEDPVANGIVVNLRSGE